MSLFRISNVREDEPHLTTFLTAKPASWSQVAGNFNIDFGTALAKNNTMVRRGLGSITHSVANAGQDAGNAAQQAPMLE